MNLFFQKKNIIALFLNMHIHFKINKINKVGNPNVTLIKENNCDHQRFKKKREIHLRIFL